MDELQRAPASARPALQVLARLYGLTRVERSMAVLLANRALAPEAAPAVRHAVNADCAALSASGGRPALQLCESFGIPDHLLLAPIAFNWMSIGSDGLHS